MAANPITWKSLPKLAKAYNNLPFHYHASLSIRHTMHLDRLVVDSASLFVEKVEQVINEDAQHVGKFLVKYLDKLSAKESAIEGNRIGII